MSANQAMDSNCGFMSCEKLDRVASWVGASVATAFFASLERCACINLSTSHDDADDDEEAKDRPLMFTRFSSNYDSSTHSRNNPDSLPPV